MNPLLPPSSGSFADEFVRALVVLAVLGIAFAAAELWRRAGAPPAEWTRKFIHSTFGIVAMTFPWVFAHTSTLVVLGLVCGAVLLAARRAGKLRSLFDVERGSWGELYFPVAVLLLFAIGRERPLFYAISLAALVVCDALAAVLGRAYGRHAYRVTTDRKSLEGSLVFLLSAFLVFHLPLLLFSDVDRLGSVLIGAQLALLVASFEAISGKGSDNLVVPLATYYLLVKLTGNTTAGIAFQLTVQVLLLLLALAVAWDTRFFSLSGAVAAHLVLYAAFSLGGPGWSVAPLCALAGFVLLDAFDRRAIGPATRLPRTVRVIFDAAVVATACLFAANTFATLAPLAPGLSGPAAFFAPFVGALAAPLAVALRWTLDGFGRTRGWPTGLRSVVAGVVGWCAVVPLGIAAVRGHVAVEEAAITAFAVAAALALYALGTRMFHAGSRERGDLRLLAASVLGATLLVLPLHFTLVAPGVPR